MLSRLWDLGFRQHSIQLANQKVYFLLEVRSFGLLGLGGE